MRDEKDPILSWAALLHDIGKPEAAWIDKDGRTRYFPNPDLPGSLDHAEVALPLAEKILTKQEVDADYREEILYLVRYHGYSEDRDASSAPPRNLNKRARKFIKKHGNLRALRLLRLRLSDHSSKNNKKSLNDAKVFSDLVQRLIAETRRED